MMHLGKFIKTVPIEANVMAAIAAIALLAKIFIFNKLYEVIEGTYELGIVIEGLLASIIASYIFYLFVVHLKVRSDSAVLYPYLSKHSKRIVDECVGQLIEISKASGVALALTQLSGESTKLALSKIQPYSQAPLIIDQAGTYANWFQYFVFHNNRTKDSIRKLFDQLPFLEAKHIGLISAIDDCPHFYSLDVVLGIKVRNSDLSAWASTFHAYCALCCELESYNQHMASRSAP